MKQIDCFFYYISYYKKLIYKKSLLLVRRLSTSRGSPSPREIVVIAPKPVVVTRAVPGCCGASHPGGKACAGTH